MCVGALAVGGQRTHEPGDALWVVLVIAWPFAAAAIVAHVALGMRRRPTPRLWPEGVLVVAVTYGLGMLLRAASGRGLAPGFLVVAALFLVATMLGWRLVEWLVRRRQAR